MTFQSVDLRNDRTVSEEEALNLAKLYRCKYVEISALTGENVTSAITEILEEITKINSNAKGPVRNTKSHCRLLFLLFYESRTTSPDG